MQLSSTIFTPYSALTFAQHCVKHCWLAYRLLQRVTIYVKPITNLSKLQRVQGNRIRLVCYISTCRLHDSGRTTVDLLHDLHWLPIRNSRTTFKIALLCHKELHFEQPEYFSTNLHKYTPSRVLRSSALDRLTVPPFTTTTAARGIFIRRTSSLEFFNILCAFSSSCRVFQITVKDQNWLYHYRHRFALLAALLFEYRTK